MGGFLKHAFDYRRPYAGRMVMILAGTVAGLAQASAKFTLVFVSPACWFLMYCWATSRRRSWRDGSVLPPPGAEALSRRTRLALGAVSLSLMALAIALIGPFGGWIALALLFAAFVPRGYVIWCECQYTGDILRD